MSQQSLNLSVKGLHTYNSELSGVPEGALSVADNLNINRLNIAEVRRGFNFLDYNLPLDADRIKKLFFFNQKLFTHYGTTFAYYNTASGYTSLGTASAVSGLVMRSAEMNKNLYVTTSTGVKKLANSTTQLVDVGAPKGLDIVTANSAALTGFLAVNSYVAYRYIIGTKDANKNFIRGGVSQRRVHQNTAATTKNVDLTCYIPSGLTTSHFVQLYRTKIGTTVPNDEVQLCYEIPIAAGDIASGFVLITDIVPDDLLGAALYTNPSQEGLVNDNAQPPVARDLAEYKNHLFLAYPTSKHRYFLTLIACGGTLGLQVDDTITIGGQVYTAKAAENVASKQFLVDTASASLSLRIDTTIRSLIKVLNQNASSSQYAYLIGDDNSLPGKVLLEERGLGGASFAVISSRTTAWSPQLQTSGTTESSSNDEFKNALMYSKQFQPEAVPLKNILYVGSSDAAILRIAALQDGLFIFKEDGIFVLRGENEASFTVSLLDNTAKLIAAESVAVVNNLIHGLCESGVVQVSNSGVEFISTPIKDKMLTLFGTALAQVKAQSFGVGYNTEGKYLLWMPASPADTSPTQAYVFDVYGKSWARWIQNVTCGGVNPADDKLYMGSSDANKVRIERKAFDYTDVATDPSTKVISAYTGLSVTLSGTDQMVVGDLLIQGTNEAYITAVSPSTGSVTVDLTVSWTIGNVTHLKAIPVAIEWNPEVAGNPAGLKHFTECLLLFKRNFVKDVAISFSTDSNPSINQFTIEGPNGSGNWGDFEWGDVVWGGDPSKQPIRVLVPRPAARCSQLTVRLDSTAAYSDWQLNGVSLVYTPTSTRVAR